MWPKGRPNVSGVWNYKQDGENDAVGKYLTIAEDSTIIQNSWNFSVGQKLEWNDKNECFIPNGHHWGRVNLDERRIYLTDHCTVPDYMKRTIAQIWGYCTFFIYQFAMLVCGIITVITLRRDVHFDVTVEISGTRELHHTDRFLQIIDDW